jgi:hypothetical protein
MNLRLISNWLKEDWQGLAVIGLVLLGWIKLVGALDNSKIKGAKTVANHMAYLTVPMTVIITVLVWLFWSGVYAAYIFLFLTALKVEQMRQEKTTRK